MRTLFFTATVLALAVTIVAFIHTKQWQSKFVQVNPDGSLHYTPDGRGNILPDFSRVGYKTGNVPIPDVPMVQTIAPGPDAAAAIQKAIDDLSKRPLAANGFRGAILLKKGTYSIPGNIKISASGIVLRGEGAETILVAQGNNRRALINVSGTGDIKEVKDTRTALTDNYVPVGAKSFTVANAAAFKPGDAIIVHWAAKQQWIEDLKMNQIEARPGTKQWQASEYDFKFQRTVTKVSGNTVFTDNPVVMAMESKYNTAEIYKYTFDGRITNVGVENLYCASAYTSDTSEEHSWDAVLFNKIENGWVRNVTARYFAYSCVNLGGLAKNITVTDCYCFDHKSIITGGRRYSFNNGGQQNLFMNCKAKDGRHDYVTGAKVCGPNVFIIARHLLPMQILALTIAGRWGLYMTILLQMVKSISRTAAIGAAGTDGRALTRSFGIAPQKKPLYKIPGYPVKIIVSGLKGKKQPEDWRADLRVCGKVKTRLGWN